MTALAVQCALVWAFASVPLALWAGAWLRERGRLAT